MQLAEFNIGILRYDWEDPRVADFRDNLDRIFALAARSPGYVWHLGGDEMEAAQREAGGVLGGNPRTASTLSVWDNLETFEHFVWRTVHKRFVDRRAEWYDATNQPTRLVMWWVDEGHRPSIQEAAERLAMITQHGETETAFGWTYARANYR